MKTKEIIDGKEVNIDWQFIEIMERHDSNYCHWMIEGEGDDGKLYQASCFSDADDHEYWEDLTDIELINP